MNIWKISFKNIQSKPLYTSLSVAILSVSIALLISTQQIKVSFAQQMQNNLGTIDMVVGAKGSPLQLVLSSVLHIDNPTGNIPLAEAKKLANNPMIKSAIPLSYGDNYKGFRIVGTEITFIEMYHAKLAKGSLPKKSLEVVLGAETASRTNLTVGDSFKSSHGLIENTIDIHHSNFTVVGILQPTQKVIDRLIVTKLESIWDVHHLPKKEKDHEHDAEHHSHEKDTHKHVNTTDEEKEVTAVLVTFRSPRAVFTMPRNINNNTKMQAALPKYELDRLYEFTGIGFTTISWVAYLILILSGVTIFINLYKMVKERAYDLALLRTYGASNFQLVKIVGYEGIFIAFCATVFGFILSKFALLLVTLSIEDSLNQAILVGLPLQEIVPILGLVFAMVLLSIALAIYPILKMNISTILSNEK